MAQGLRHYLHQEVEYRTESYIDEERGVSVKKIMYMCMICGRVRCEKYDCYLPPPKPKDKSKVLEKNKRRYRD